MPKLVHHDAIWTLDLGADENRLSPDWITEIMHHLDEVAAADQPAALLTRGTGKFFCNGLDQDWLESNPDAWSPYVDQVQALFTKILTLPVPTIAAVNGHAFGAGVMIALAHDFRVMRADRGFMCLPEVDIRIPFTPGMAALVQSKLTPRTAVEAMTTGRRYGGHDAVAAGLVDLVATEDELLQVAADRVTPLAGKDPATLATIKSTMFADVVEALGRGQG